MQVLVVLASPILFIRAIGLYWQLCDARPSVGPKVGIVFLYSPILLVAVVSASVAYSVWAHRLRERNWPLFFCFYLGVIAMIIALGLVAYGFSVGDPTYSCKGVDI
jgi:uncharacterized membrane protein YhaH (DUF805 family)